MKQPVSLRRLLFIWLVLPLSAMLLLTAFLAYPFAVHSVRSGYDEALMDTAHSLARLIPTIEKKSAPMPGDAADTVLRMDQFDRIYYAVHRADGALLVGDAALAAPSAEQLSGGALFYDAIVDAEPVRVAALLLQQDGRSVIVQAAETKVKRQRLTRHILIGMLVIEAVLLATVAFLVWLGIGKGLEPLRGLSHQIEALSSRDMRLIPEDQVPVEAQSIVRALNELLQRLSAVLRSQQDFVSNAAHQLRTPLAGLQMEIEYALRQREPDEWRRALQTLAPLSARTAHLVNQLLTLARTDGGTSVVSTTFEPVDLRRQVVDVAAQWMPQAIAKDIDLGLELDDAVVPGNPFLLNELISNLIDNAIQYSRPRGRVTVRTHTRRGVVAIEVEDEGIGIPREERQNVLRRFYRVADAPGGGCGLGLAIVREIAELHGAVIDIRQPPGGKGTLVAICFDTGSVVKAAA
jgi:two-component system, OmpR family, sensor histidine kinase TctE